jgi:hypothetical protein
MTAQVRPLVALRWRMVRSTPARWGFVTLASIVPLLCLAAVVVGVLLPDRGSLEALLLAPTAYLAIAVVALVAPLVAGGGPGLFSDDQLVAYPVSSRTQFHGALALTPLNLAWSAQVIGLIGITAYMSPDSPLMALAIVTCLAYVAFITVLGLATAWLIVGFRQTRLGRAITWGLAFAAILATVGVVATGNVAVTLNSLPTTYVVIGAVNGASGAYTPWLATTALLVAFTAMTLRGGRWACDWALRQPGAARRSDAREVRRRRAAPDVRAALLATDRASVWRSAPLRRGLLVLAVLPGLVAALAGLDWPSMVLLPGLVAAGSALLFGVNAFCLDGSGSIWLASLPGYGRFGFWSKAQVLGEVCLVAVGVTLVAGSLRADRLPTVDEATAVTACAVVVMLRVIATCMTLSVTRPHRADLRGPRDTPAPPGTMAAYSVRLAVSTTLIAVLFAGLAEAASWHWSVLCALPFALLSLRRLVRAAAAWSRPVTLARVATVVAIG